jgi:arylsulfatase A-like enzyme
MAVRVPLLVKVPGKPKAVGQVTKSYTDLVDVFPTVATLAGLSAPAGVDGDDVSAVFDDPATLVKQAAYHQYPACNMKLAAGFNTTRGACNNTPKNKFSYMGCKPELATSSGCLACTATLAQALSLAPTKLTDFRPRHLIL